MRQGSYMRVRLFIVCPQAAVYIYRSEVRLCRIIIEQEPEPEGDNGLSHSSARARLISPGFTISRNYALPRTYIDEYAKDARERGAGPINKTMSLCDDLAR